MKRNNTKLVSAAFLAISMLGLQLISIQIHLNATQDHIDKLGKSVKTLEQDRDYQTYLNGVAQENIDTLFNNIWHDADRLNKLEKTDEKEE